VFSLINAVLLRPINGTTSGTLMAVSVGDRTRPGAWRFFSYPEYLDVRQHADLFQSVIAETPAGPVSRRWTGAAITARIVSSNFFAALGGTMAAGRGFTAAEENPSAAAPVAVVGYPFWRRHGFDPALVGSSLRINGRPFMVVGVAPEGFTGVLPLMAADVWFPFGAGDMLSATSSPGLFGRVANDRQVQSLVLTALLRDGVTEALATQRLDPLAAAWPTAASGGARR
jgi:hypothetical protein